MGLWNEDIGRYQILRAQSFRVLDGRLPVIVVRELVMESVVKEWNQLALDPLLFEGYEMRQFSCGRVYRFRWRRLRFCGDGHREGRCA
jgi:hypothetical protein